jgi:hypothetical protein
MEYPYYKHDSDADEYTLLDKPPRAKLTALREVEFDYVSDGKPNGRTYTVIMDATEDCEGGRIIRAFKAWVFK